MINTKYLNTVLTAIALLLALNLWVGVNASPGERASLETQAVAQGSVTSGQQRAEMIKELKGIKSTVESLSEKLTSGSITVKVEGDAGKD